MNQPVRSIAAPSCGPSAYGVNEHANLAHDPRTGGENDQTSNARHAVYQSRMVNGKKYTMDRSTAKQSQAWLHRIPVCRGDGQCLQYGHPDNFDWHDRSHVVALNRWREQAGS